MDTTWLDELAQRQQDLQEFTRVKVGEMAGYITELEERIVHLKQQLAECEEGGGTGNGTPDRIFCPDCNRILWATQLGENEITHVLDSGLRSDVAAVVCRLDLAARDYGQRILTELRYAHPKMQIGAYVRAPVHMAASPSLPPYERAIYDLCVDAILKRADGSSIWRTPYDLDLNVRNVPVQEHARLTAEYLQQWNWDFALLDGLTTWQIYTADVWHADWDQDGQADYLTTPWQDLATRQREVLTAWVRELRSLSDDLISLIGNGAWEPMNLELTERWGPVGEPLRWEMKQIPPEITHSPWLNLLEGCMVEDPTNPYYHLGSPLAQGPRLSETLYLMMLTALEWRRRGRWFFMGGTFAQFGTETEAAVSLQKGLSLILDCWYIASRDPLPGWTGEAVGPAISVTTNIPLQETRTNMGTQSWRRPFANTGILVDPRRGSEGAWRE